MNEFLQTQCKEVTKNIESLFETLSAVLDATHETYSTCDIRINERGDFAVVDADNKIVGSVSRDFNEMKIICAKFTNGDVVATCSRYAGDSKPAVEEYAKIEDKDYKREIRQWFAAVSDAEIVQEPTPEIEDTSKESNVEEPSVEIVGEENEG